MTGSYGSATRESGGGISRFVSVVPHADRKQAELRPSHPALTEGRSLFPSRVLPPGQANSVLVSGINSPKIGRRIMKGAWSGLPVFTLTLEERATCPRSCGLWSACYGNAMPAPQRHIHGAELEDAIEASLIRLMAKHRRGIAVRLHVLGDFYSPEYIRKWSAWMYRFPKLRVWGYTAHPASSRLGNMLDGLNALYPDRWVMRFSVDPMADFEDRQATTIWRQPESANVPEGMICPASAHKTAACGTCGLCWDPTVADKRIVFIGHGMNKARSRWQMPNNPIARAIHGAGGVRAVAAGMAFHPGTITRWRNTGRVPEGQLPAFERLIADLTPAITHAGAKRLTERGTTLSGDASAA